MGRSPSYRQLVARLRKKGLVTLHTCVRGTKKIKRHILYERVSGLYERTNELYERVCGLCERVYELYERVYDLYERM